MRKFKTLIVDDELHGRENLRLLLTGNCPDIEILGEADTVSNAITKIHALHPEVVFLDILMPMQSGFDLLDHFPERNFVVVFVSASMEFGIQAVKAGVLDYVIKPINISELKTTVNKIVHHFSKPNLNSVSQQSKITKIALAYSGGFAIEELVNIVRLQADDNYTRVFTVSGKQYLISRPLKDFERSLPPEVFLRTHKSHMINIQYLKDFCNEDGGIAILKDGIKIPVSKRKGPVFVGELKKLSLMFRS